jgi:hypothetical protein
MGSAPSHSKNITELNTIARMVDEQYQNTIHPFIVIQTYTNSATRVPKSEKMVKVIGAFSCKVFAEQYIYRCAINTVLKLYITVTADKTKLIPSRDEFMKMVENVLENYKIFLADELSLEKIIYNTNANKICRYDQWRNDYLTNNYIEIDSIYGKLLDTSWLNEYIVELDPELPLIGK